MLMRYHQILANCEQVRKSDETFQRVTFSLRKKKKEETYIFKNTYFMALF